MDKALFQPKTATGKLNALMIPTSPMEFHCSSMTWFGLSDGNIEPLNILDMPTA